MTLELKVPVVIEKEDKWYIASCPLLDVITQGETAAKAKKNLIEALQLFILTCFEMGTLEEVLRQSGFKKFESVSKPKKTVVFKNNLQTINIPLQSFAEPVGKREPCHV